MLGKMTWLWNANVRENLDALRNKMKLLEAKESDNLTELKNEEIQPGKRPRTEVNWWLKNVQDKKAEFKMIETEFQEKGPSSNLKDRIENMTKDVDELIEQGKFPEGVVLDDHASTRLPLVITGLVGQSCSKNIASVLSLLKGDNGVFAIGIHGMGGVGKTTLMRHIHNELLQDSEFEGKVYWVTASQQCSLEKLQVDIGKVLGLDDISHHDNERRKASLFRRFLEIGKCVLFLDDLWKHYLIEDIGIACSFGGCKLILSTRSLDVCNRMNCHKTIRISPLSKSDSMKLFIETRGAALPIVLNPIAEEIVAECGGLPLALKTMGCCMRGVDDIHEWQNVLFELRTPKIRQDSMEEDVFRVLKFSYNNLKDKEIQYCFLSCVLFPEDYAISQNELVRYWIHGGLLDEAENEQDKKNRGKAILNRLEKSCLLESVINFYDEKCVKMHDLVRDMAIIITQDGPRFMAKSGTNLEKVPEKEQWREDILMVSLSSNWIGEIPCDLAPMTMKLSMLLFYGNPLKEIPTSFFIHMRELRVLDLRKTDIEMLPDSISEMTNLRALFLSDCWELRYVPTLGKLSKLRILDLTSTNIERVPEGVSNLENLMELLLGFCKLIYVPSLVKLTNLRVLDFRYVELLEKAPIGLEKLKELEELSYCPWNTNDMSGFCRLFKSLPSLNCYRFYLSPQEKLPDFNDGDLFCDSLYDHGKAMWIASTAIGEDDTVYVPITCESLLIKKCEFKGRRRTFGDVFTSLGEATNLKRIVIEEYKGLEYIMQSDTLASLDTIEKLDLVGLPDLKRIVEYGAYSFAKLQTLYICECPNIKKVFPIALTNYQLSLPNLQNLIVIACEELEEIFESNNSTLPNPVLVLSYLDLSYLPKLESIYKGLLFSSSWIEMCPKLEVLDGKEVVCDASPSTLASISSEHSKGWWDDLRKDYPEAASELHSLLYETPPPESEDDESDSDISENETEDDEISENEKMMTAIETLATMRMMKKKMMMIIDNENSNATLDENDTDKDIRE